MGRTGGQSSARYMHHACLMGSPRGSSLLLPRLGGPKATRPSANARKHRFLRGSEFPSPTLVSFPAKGTSWGRRVFSVVSPLYGTNSSDLLRPLQLPSLTVGLQAIGNAPHPHQSAQEQVLTKYDLKGEEGNQRAFG